MSVTQLSWIVQIHGHSTIQWSSSRDVHVYILHRERLIPHGKIWLMIAATFPLLWQIPYLTHLLPCWQAYLFECSKKKNWSMKQSSHACKELFCCCWIYHVHTSSNVFFFQKKLKSSTQRFIFSWCRLLWYVVFSSGSKRQRDVVFARKYEQSHGLSIIKAQ